MLKKLNIIIFFLFMYINTTYGFEIGEFNLSNCLDLLHNDTGSPYRLGYFGNWRYKNLFFLKTVYRADYNSNLHDTTFSQFIPDFGVYLYKNIALRYQYEEKRTRTKKKISTATENRLGFSIELKRSLFNKKLSWLDDIEFFFYESKSDQRIRWSAKLKYGKISFLNVVYVDFDRDKKWENVDFSYFDQVTLGYSIYNDKQKDLAIKFQVKKQTKMRDIYRIGMGIEF